MDLEQLGKQAKAFVVAATTQRRERAEAMLAAMPEIERDPWTRLVLGRDWGGDPNEQGGPRGWAPLLYVCYGFSRSTVATSTGRAERRGAATCRCGARTNMRSSADVDPSDLAVAAVARGERPQTPLPDRLDPDVQEVLILAALRGRLELVVDLVGANFRGVMGGSPEGTLLHHAAWVGHPETVRELLRRGAVPDADASGTPLAWAALASQYHRLPGRDYVAVAELLAAAGNTLDRSLLDDADGPLYDWLEERLADAA